MRLFQYLLDRGGRLIWDLFTGKGDEGTTLHWPTPHRLARVIDNGKMIFSMARQYRTKEGLAWLFPTGYTPDIWLPGSGARKIKSDIGDVWLFPEDQGFTSRARVIPVRRCVLKSVQPAVIRLELMNTRHWTIHFPDKDVLMPQPPEEPNLFIADSKVKNPFVDNAKKKQRERAGAEAGDKQGGAPGEEQDELTDEEKAAEEAAMMEERLQAGEKRKAEKESAEAAEKQAAGTGTVGAGADGETKPKKGGGLAGAVASGLRKGEEMKARYVWSVTPRGTYTMSSRYFSTSGSPSGTRGICRYRFRNAPMDPKSGIIECIHLDGYDALKVHLTCSGPLAAKRESPGSALESKLPR